MEENIKERLTSYLKYKGINKSEFGRIIGVSNAYISSMRKSIQPDKAEKIASSFPDLNISWLMTGEGEMLISGVVQNNQNGSNIHGHTVNYQSENSTEKLIDMLKKKDEQIDRLLTLLENKYKAE